MNALYVTVSIPILLVLAGFNHAHGLTTFGKSNGQGQGNSAQQVQGKPCTSQINCTFVRGTTCLRHYCLCGDNTHPTNGICTATYRGHGHICKDDNECVDDAICLEPEEQPVDTMGQTVAPYKVCQCLDNKSTPIGTCSGGTGVVIIPGLLLVSIFVAKAF